jgi:hypothetical protein
MATGQDVECKPRSSRVAYAIHLGLTAYGLSPAWSGDMAQARAFAAGLIGPDIASPGVLDRVQRRTGAALYLAHEGGRLTGVWASVLLTEAGVRACHADRFEALNPDLKHVAENGFEPAGVYGWGIAASTRDTARRIVAAGESLFLGALAHLPHFARPVTAAGVRLSVDRFSFQPVPHATSGLVWMPPRERHLPSVAA